MLQFKMSLYNKEHNSEIEIDQIRVPIKLSYRENVL